MTIQFADGNGKCLYQQIYEYIRDEIKKGKLPEGEKLPSTRSLAEYLQVARSTVDAAYGQLVAEGYLEARACRGYFVSPSEGLLDIYGSGFFEGRGEMPSGSGKERQQAGFPTGEKELPKQALVKYDFSPHAISLKDFPFATWKKITKNILVYANSEMFALGEAQGDCALRGTIARYLHSSRGVNCTPEQVIVGAGNDYLFMLLEKILGRHVPVAMEEPTYKRAYQIFQSFAYQVEAIPMDENGMDVEKLRRTKARLAYVMPSHQYPTGVVMPIGRRLELLKWAGEGEGRYIIEDDYDSEFRYRGKPIPALQASDRGGRVIYMGTFSKSIAPAIRVGYMVLPLSLLRVYQENCGFYSCTVSRIDQRILNEFIRDGYFERYLNRMRKIYRGRHDFLLGKIACFEREFAISGENAGLHILLTSRSNIPEKELIEAAAGEGVRLYGIGDACMRRQKASDVPPSGTILLGYGALEEQELSEGIGLIKKAWSAWL